MHRKLKEYFHLLGQHPTPLKLHTHNLLVPLVSVGAVEDIVHSPRLDKDGAKREGECYASNPQSSL